jgi:hypothetical protein
MYTLIGVGQGDMTDQSKINIDLGIKRCVVTHQHIVVLRITVLNSREGQISARICLIWEGSDIAGLIGIRPLIGPRSIDWEMYSSKR